MNEEQNLNSVNPSMKEKAKNYVMKARVAILAAAMIGVASQFAFQSAVFAKDKESKPAPAVQLHVDNTPMNRELKLTTSFAPVVKKISPSVVKVNITGKAPKEADLGGMEDPMLRRFFGEQFKRRG